MNHLDIPGNLKIVKTPINTCTTLRNDDIIVTSLKNTSFHKKKKNSEFIPPLLWPPNSPDLNPVDCSVWGILQEKVYIKRRVTDLDDLKHPSELSGPSWITSSLQLLCISGVVVSQRASRPAMVISNSFWFRHCVCSDNCDLSCSRWPVEQFGLIAVVSYGSVLCNTWQLSNLQGKVATLIRWGRHLLC